MIGELVVTADEFLNRDKNAITFVGYMDVDREAELVYITRSGGTVWPAVSGTMVERGIRIAPRTPLAGPQGPALRTRT